MVTCLFSSLLATVLAPVLPEVMAGRHPLVRGALIGDHANTLGLVPQYHSVTADVIDPNDPAYRFRQFGQPVLLRRPLSLGGERTLFDFHPIAVLQSAGWTWDTRGRMATPQRWQVAGGLVYSAMMHDVLGDLRPGAETPKVPDYYGIRAFPLTPSALDGCQVRTLKPSMEELAKRYASNAAHTATAPSAGLDEFFSLLGGPGMKQRPLPPDERWRAHFDFVFEPGGYPELYVGSPGWLTRYRSTLHPTKSGRPEFRWHLVDSYSPEWEGPFYAVVDGDTRHFIVPGGRIVSLAAAGNPVESLWDRDPVLALIHDSDAGKSYAFTRTHYFHVTSKPDPKPHDIKAFPGATAEEALDTVAKCGRVIRGLK